MHSCNAFYFYVLLANDYSAALFYALCAILCLGNFELARKAIPLVETQSSSWSVSLYMIFFFLYHLEMQGNMSQDKDIDCLPGC